MITLIGEMRKIELIATAAMQCKGTEIYLFNIYTEDTDRKEFEGF
ncbi:MAG TPA: hypothetical protein VIF82_08385 [Burkholderiaceae bacterium]|jgi:hypothetical protein